MLPSGEQDGVDTERSNCPSTSPRYRNELIGPASLVPSPGDRGHDSLPKMPWHSVQAPAGGVDVGGHDLDVCQARRWCAPAVEELGSRALRVDDRNLVELDTAMAVRPRRRDGWDACAAVASCHKAEGDTTPASSDGERMGLRRTGRRAMARRVSW